MAKNTGLGKGLSALFENSVTEVPKEEEKRDGEVIQTLKLIDIEPNRAQPRRKFDEEALEELAESIKRYGVIQPIIVTKRDNYYEIVAGERRWRASKKANLIEIPVIVRDYDERKNKEIALIENIQREDLNPIEKALGIKSLMEDYKLTQQEVADQLGKSRSGIANTIRILNLDERVIAFALEGKLTEGHCKALLAVSDPEKQYNMAIYMIESGDSVRDAEKKMNLRKKMKKKDEKYEAVYRDIEDSFRGFFGTKVKVDAKQNRGKIVIEYTSNDDLERLLNLVK